MVPWWYHDITRSPAWWHHGNKVLWTSHLPKFFERALMRFLKKKHQLKSWSKMFWKFWNKLPKMSAISCRSELGMNSMVSWQDVGFQWVLARSLPSAHCFGPPKNWIAQISWVSKIYLLFSLRPPFYGTSQTGSMPMFAYGLLHMTGQDLGHSARSTCLSLQTSKCWRYRAIYLRQHAASMGFLIFVQRYIEV